MKTICLNTPSSTATIYIGGGCVKEKLPALTKGQKNFVLTDSNVYALYQAFFKEYFSDAGLFVLPAGEESKTFAFLQELLAEMVKAGLHRNSRLFAVGGGVVGDLGGFAASVYMRGIDCVQIPTTLLAQVDSSVGGKTAVDFCGVKNIVGAFYQPSVVLVDPSFLRTLPAREVKCGLGEIVKYAALDKDIFERLEAQTERGLLTDEGFLLSLIEDCIRHKAGVCERDEKEAGERKSLNVGHTTGHAIELSSGLSHGECVLYGMLLETQIAIEKGVCEKDYGESLLDLVRAALSVPPESSPNFSLIEQTAEKAKADKKNSDDGKVRMAVAMKKGEWTILSLPFEEYAAALKNAVNSLKL